MNNPWDTSQFKVPEEPAKPKWLTEELEARLKGGGFSCDQDGMLLLWQRSKEMLALWKETEMEYRKICVDILVPEKHEGINNVELGNGFVAKVGVKFNYKLDSDNDRVWAALEKIETTGNQGKFIAERLVSWTPNFLKTEYTTLKEEAEKGSQDAIVILKIVHDEMLTVTDAAPTLEIKAPKEKAKK